MIFIIIIIVALHSDWPMMLTNEIFQIDVTELHCFILEEKNFDWNGKLSKVSKTQETSFS